MIENWPAERVVCSPSRHQDRPIEFNQRGADLRELKRARATEDVQEASLAARLV